MSEPTTDSLAIADNVNGFGGLNVSNVGGAIYTVTSYRNDTKTAHEVNLDARTCTCEDYQFNCEDEEVCDHIIVVGHYAPRVLSIEEQTVNVVLETLRDLREMREAGPKTYPASQAMDTDGTDSDDAGASDGTDSGASQADAEAAVGAVEAWLVDQDVDHSQVQVSVGAHGDTDGVRVDWMKADLGDKDHEYLKSLINGIDGTTYHAGWMDDGCQTCNQADGEGFYHFPVDVARGL